jgi:hypothetical protein
VGDSQESSLQTTVLGPGRLTFWWKVSSEVYYVWLEFYINDVLQPGRISGEVDWRRRVVYIPAGSQTLRWRYIKDINKADGADAAWVDQVTFEPGIWLELSRAPTNGRSRLILHGVPGRLYTVQAATNAALWSNPANWFSLTPSVVASSPAMPFTDTNAAPGMRLYRLRDVSVSLGTPVRSSDGVVQLTVQNPSGLPVVLQVSTNCLTWTPFQTNPGTAFMVTNTDRYATNAPLRFYRAVIRP